MDSVSFAEAGSDLESVIDRVISDRTPLAIIRDDRAEAVLIAAGEWAAIEAIIGGSPAAQL